MKHLIKASLVALLTITAFGSCKNCAKCHADVMGIKGPEQEICGDQLEQAKKTPGMICE
ncbi:MAG TPA: hypothetical protein VL098_03210 [Flavipsychrobacter sp.]|nr:hypothetical protein [Flavipsychrobacter sp.]